MGSGCKDPNFLDLGTSWRWVVSFSPLPLFPRGKSPRYPLERIWVDPRAGLDDGEKRKFLTLPGLELRPLGRPARSQSLSRLLGYVFWIGIVGGGVQLGPLGTAATNTPIMPAPGDYVGGEIGGMIWQGNPTYSEKTCPSASLSTTNPTCCPDSKPDRRGGNPATNRLSYGTAGLCLGSISCAGIVVPCSDLGPITTYSVEVIRAV
jgi:hypothetical protein